MFRPLKEVFDEKMGQGICGIGHHDRSVHPKGFSQGSNGGRRSVEHASGPPSRQPKGSGQGAGAKTVHEMEGRSSVSSRGTQGGFRAAQKGKCPQRQSDVPRIHRQPEISSPGEFPLRPFHRFGRRLHPGHDDRCPLEREDSPDHGPPRVLRRRSDHGTGGGCRQQGK